MAARGGVRAWAIFGELGVRGLGETVSRLIGFNLAARRGTSIVKNLTRGVVNLGRRLGFLIKLTTLSGTVIAGLGAAAVKSFADFQDALNQSLAIMGRLSTAMREDMAEAAERVGRTTRFSAQQAGEAFFFLASAGLDAKQSLAALPAVADFAQAGMFDLATATELLADAQKALGLNSQDAAENLMNLRRVGDVLVKANTLAQATVEEFGQALTNKVAARARSLNIPLEETVGLLAVMAERGLKGRRAGQQLNIVLRDLARFAIQNADAFDEFGLRVFDANGNFRNMADILADVENRLSGMSTQERVAAVQALNLTRRSNDVLVRLIGTSDRLREFQRELQTAGGFARRVAQNQLKSLTAQFELLQGVIGSFGREIGKALAPQTLRFIFNLEDFFNNLDASQVAGFFQDAFGFMLSGIDSVITGIVKGIDFVRNMDPIIQKLGILGFLFFGTKGVATIAILQAAGERIGAGLARAFIGEDTVEGVVADKLEKFRTATDRLSRVSDRTQEISRATREAINDILPDGQELPQRALTVAEALNIINRQALQWQKTAEDVRAQEKELTEETSNLAEEWDGLAGIFGDLFEIPRGESLDSLLFEAGVRQMKREMRGLETEGGAVATALGLVTKKTDKMSDSFRTTVNIFRDTTRGAHTMDAALEAVSQKVDDFFAGINVRDIRQKFQKATDEMEKLIINPLRRTKDRVKKILREMTEEEFDELIQGMVAKGASKEVISDLVDLFKEAQEEGALGASLKRVGRNLGQQLVFGIVEGGFELEDFLKSALSTLINAALFSSGGLFSTLKIFSPSKVTMEAGRQITRGLAKGIESETNRVQRAMGTVSNIVASETGALSMQNRARMQRARTRPAPVRGGTSGGRPVRGAGSGQNDLSNRPLLVVDPEKLQPMTAARLARDPMVGRLRQKERDFHKLTGANR